MRGRSAHAHVGIDVAVEHGVSRRSGEQRDQRAGTSGQSSQNGGKQGQHMRLLPEQVNEKAPAGGNPAGQRDGLATESGTSVAA